MNTLFDDDIIKSCSFDEGEILRNIRQLHLPEWIELDPTYSIGNIYTRFGLPKPKLKFDLYPQSDEVQQASADSLPIESNSIKSIMYDPPFLAGQTKCGQAGIMESRFTMFNNIKELWLWYEECLKEFYRILEPDGVLLVKCQDTVDSHKNYFSHIQIFNLAVQAGYYPKDLFVLLSKNRVIGSTHGKQQHARKFHCYYWVFQKKKNKINYFLNN